MKKKAKKKRRRTAAGREWTRTLLKQVTAALKEPKPDFAALRAELGTTESGGREYLDLRGLQPTEMLLDAKWSDIDFSHAVFDTTARFARGRLEDCLFRRARFRENHLCSTFVDCDFEAAAFRRARTSNDCVFCDCRFDETDFSNAEMWAVKFERCRFHRCVMRRTEFTVCTFTACDFVDLSLEDNFISGCTFIEPIQNIRWVDAETGECGTHETDANADWLDLTEVHVERMRFK